MHPSKREFKQKHPSPLAGVLLLLCITLYSFPLYSQEARVYLAPHPTPGSPPSERLSKQWQVRIHAGDTVQVDADMELKPTNGGWGEGLLIPDVFTVTLPFSIDTSILKIVSFVSSTCWFCPGYPGWDTLNGFFSVTSQSFRNGREMITLSGGRNFSGGNALLGRLTCVALLTDSLHTSISLAGSPMTLNMSPWITADSCSAVVHIDMIPDCGDSIIQEFMRAGSLVHIDRIVPNPAAATVRVEGSGLTVEGLQVYDVMGRKVRGPESLVRGPEGELELHVRALPEGVYYLRAGQASARFEIIR